MANTKDSKFTIPAIPDNAPLSENQQAWLTGYFAGMQNAMESMGDTNTQASSSLHILYASQTGNAEGVAHDLGDATGGTVMDISDVSAEQLAGFSDVVIVSSTYGDGEHPDNGQILWDSVQDIDKLSCNYAVLGLGDTAYDFFCKSAEDWDAFFESKGAKRLLDTLKLDVDYEDQANEWITTVKDKFGTTTATNTTPEKTTPATAHKSKYTKSNPYMATILTNKNLSGDNSSKQVLHFEFDINDPDMAYEAGDALGVIPINSDALVGDIITAGGFDGTKQFDGNSLSDILKNEKEIRTPNKDILSTIAEQSGDKQLGDLLNDTNALNDWLWGRELIDILQDYNHSLDEQQFLELLKPLQHRLYSISSSPNKHSGEVHLTIAAVRYEFNGRDCQGVASCFLADRLPIGEKVGLFMHPNKNFSVPDDNTAPIIMVGPGTGIAPFRAFLEERIARDATGDNWLFFGDRTQADDFLYQDELQQWEQQGKLRLSLAWSRDESTPKTYVQDLMKQQGQDIYDQLNNGGYFYVCGDASRMAKDVDATLLEIVSTFGAMSIDKANDFISELKKQKRYVRDVY